MVQSREGAGSVSRKDLQEVLRRRRGIIDTAIVKIVKREQWETLDSIAATVSGWVEFSLSGVPPPPFPPFRTSNREVSLRNFPPGDPRLLRGPVRARPLVWPV